MTTAQKMFLAVAACLACDAIAIGAARFEPTTQVSVRDERIDVSNDSTMVAARVRGVKE